MPKIAGTVLPEPVWAVTRTFSLFLMAVMACFWKLSSSKPKSYGSEENSPSNFVFSILRNLDIINSYLIIFLNKNQFITPYMVK